LQSGGAAGFGERIELRIINALHLRLPALVRNNGSGYDQGERYDCQTS